MPYTVTATAAAEDDLAFIWGLASDKNAVSQASNEIDETLRRAPLAHAVDHGTFFTLAVGPLTAIFRAFPDDRLVTIIGYLYHG